MKVIQSEGGPLIGLEQELMGRWNGVAGKGFVGNASPFESDYEAVCNFLDTSDTCNINKFAGDLANGLLITMPLQTAIIETDGVSAYMAQVHYADEDWCFSRLSRTDFKQAKFKKQIPFSFSGNKLVFFDAAYPAEQIGDDCLSFELIGGAYILSSSLYYPDSQTHCILYSIERFE